MGSTSQPLSENLSSIVYCCNCRGQRGLFSTMITLILASALTALASASANTRTDCTALVNALREGTTSFQGIRDQQAILVGALCPSSEDPAQCEAELPDFWRAIALSLWPAYYTPEAEWMCADTCADPQDHLVTCDECCNVILETFNQLADPRTIDIVVERFLASDFCSTIPNDRCPEFLEAVLRQGIPALVGSSNPDEYPQFCNFVLPGTCPAKLRLF